MTSKNAHMDWDDLRVALAVFRGGSLSAAARALEVNQTTVSRRLQGLEQALGGRLFDRREGVHTPTALGTEVLAHGERVEAEMTALMAEVGAAGSTLSGAVRITAVGSILSIVLAPGLGRFTADHPDIHIQMIGADANLSFTRRETDLALRMGRPRAGAMLARKLTDVDYGVYGARAVFPNGADVGENPAARWVGFDDSLADIAEHRWLMRHLGTQRARERIVMKTNSFQTLVAAIGAGVGRGIVPCFVGDHDPQLVRLGERAPVLKRELWLLTHQELVSWPRIQAVSEWIRGRVAVMDMSS